MVKEKAWLGRRGQIDADIGDQEVVAVGNAGEREVEQLTQAAAGAITGQNVLAFELLLASRRAHLQDNRFRILAAAGNFVVPTQVDEVRWPRCGPAGSARRNTAAS